MLKLSTSEKTWEKEFLKKNIKVKVKNKEEAESFIKKSAVEYILDGPREKMEERIIKVFSPYDTPVIYISQPKYIDEVKTDFIVDILLDALINKGYFEIVIKQCSKATKKNAYKLILINNFIKLIYKKTKTYDFLYKFKPLFYKHCKEKKFFNAIKISYYYLTDYELNKNSASYIAAKNCIKNNGYTDLDNSSILSIEEDFKELLQSFVEDEAKELIELNKDKMETDFKSFLENITSEEVIKEIIES